MDTRTGEREMIAQFLCEAMVKDSDVKIVGGICEFINPENNEKVYMMIHPDYEGKPTVSKIDPSSIKGTFDCWKWMDDWLRAYESLTGKIKLSEFKEWLAQQPMTARQVTQYQEGVDNENGIAGIKTK